MKKILTSTQFNFSLLTLFLLCLFITLGTWQIHRGQMKQEMLSLEEAHHTSLPISNTTTLTQAMQSPEHYQYRQAELQGHFDNEHHFLLDNQIHTGQVGYHVLTPLILSNGQAILVNRGWISIKGSRQKLPDIRPITKIITINGQLEIPSNNPMIKVTESEKIDTWPKRIQKISFPEIEEYLSTTLIPMTLVLYEESAFSFRPVPKRQQWLNPERHYGYALQWFSFAVILLGLYIYFIFFKKGKLS